MKDFKLKIVIHLIYLIISIFVIVPPVCWCKNQIELCFGEQVTFFNINNILDILKLFASDFKIILIWSVIALIFYLIIIDTYFTIKKAKIENKGIKVKSEDRYFWKCRLDE